MYLPSISSTSFGVEKRYYCSDGAFGSCDGYSAWDNWGRYVVLAGIIIGAVILFFVVACVTARRRRSRGAQPLYGTGWMAAQHGNVNYYGPNNAAPQPYYGNQQYGQYSQPAPPYTAGAQQSYYGQRDVEPGIELQTPRHVYSAPSQTEDDNAYPPPAGPPPAKKGDIVR